MKTDFAKLRECVEAGKGAPTYLKIVVFDENDYQYARNVSRMFPRLPIYLQVGNHTPPQVGAVDVMGLLDRLRWLCERATADQWWNAIVTPQLHTLLYGNTRGT
jgi:7-carboxy-7-deazaguanine synthase